MNYQAYFLLVAPIWRAYFEHKISMTERDRQLSAWREYLHQLSRSQQPS